MKCIVFLLLIFTTIQCHKSESVIPICTDEPVTDTFQNWSINNKCQSDWNDIDWLAKMMMSEVADSTDIESIYLVGITAKNHTTLLELPLVQVLTRPRAFSGVNHPTYYWWKIEPTTIHKRLAIQIIKDSVPEHLSKVFAFCTLDVLPSKIAGWFLSFKIHKKIGNVTFFINEKV